DREITREQLHERTADAVAVHHRDRGLVVAVEPLPSPAISGGSSLLAFGRIPLQLAEELLEVLSGAEIAALAGHHDDLDRVVDFEPRERVIHLVVQAGDMALRFSGRLSAVQATPARTLTFTKSYL